MSGVDLYYMRPCGVELNKFVIERGNLSKDEIEPAVNWYGYHLMVALLKSSCSGVINSSCEPLKMQLAVCELDKTTRKSEGHKIAEKIAKKAFANVKTVLGLPSGFFSPEYFRYDHNPSRINIKISADVAQAIRLPFIPRPAANPNEPTPEELHCYAEMLKDRSLLNCSHLALQARVESDNLDEAMARIQLSHRFHLPKLKILGSTALSKKISQETFLRIDQAARDYQLVDLSNICLCKITFDTLLKRQIDDLLADSVSKKGETFLRSILIGIRSVAIDYNLPKTIKEIRKLLLFKNCRERGI